MICFVCKSHHASSNLLVRHLKLKHGLCPGRTLRLKCGETGCSHVSGTFSGFRKHLNKLHGHVAHNVRFVDGNSSDHSGNDLPIDDVTLEPVIHSATPISKSSLQSMCANIVAQLQAAGIGQGNVQSLVSSLEEVTHEIQDQVKESVLSCLSANQSVGEIRNSLSQLENPFTQLNSVAKRDIYFSEKWGVVSPVQKVLGVRFDKRWNKITGTYDQVSVRDTLAYIPILLTLQSVLKHSNITDMFKPLSSSKRCYTDLRDGAFFKKNPLFSCDTPTLQIQLFYDDFETCNPLGSKRGIHKLGAIYFTLRNFPPKYNSCLTNIHLCMLFHAQDIKKYGFSAVLEPLVSDLKMLETKGIDIPALGGCIKGGIVQVTGDNLGIHTLFGFVESFSARHCCRFCLVCKTDFQKVFSEDHPDMILRSKEVHAGHCQLIQSTPEQGNVFGVKGECLLNSLTYFHTIDNFAVDIMHDVLEGVAQLEVKLILKYIAEKSISFKEINQRIQSFNYGYMERRNQPPGVKLDDLSNDLGLNAIQSWCLLRNVPLLFGDLVEKNDSHWNVLLLLLQIVNIVFAPFVTEGMTVSLKYLIVEHHTLFKCVFPSKNLIPKHHFMVHYPRCIRNIGPLIHMWCMRYEGKHNFFKRQMKCYKNLTLSLAKKHQHHMAYHWETYSEKKLVVGPGKEITISSLFASEQLALKMNVSLTSSVSSVKWVKSCGIEYRIGLVICSGVLDEMPVFQKIEGIVVKEESVFLVVTMLQTIYFDEHLYAFRVVKPRSDLHTVIKTEELEYYRPFDLQMTHSMEDDQLFIVPYCHLF